MPSDVTEKGHPKRAKNSFTAALAVVSAVCDGRGTISHHFVNWSTITKMLVFPRGVSKEEIMSLNHDLVCTGHQGVQRTRERIKQGNIGIECTVM
jgi:hypothetical protein